VGADTRLRASVWEFGRRILHRGYIVLVGIAGGMLGAYNEFFGAVKLSPEQAWVSQAPHCWLPLSGHSMT
jgi:hypothetical protein